MDDLTARLTDPDVIDAVERSGSVRRLQHICEARVYPM